MYAPSLTLPVLWLLAALILPNPAAAQDADYTALAKELAALRAQVEQAESELRSQRARSEASIRSLVEQRSELEVMIQREQLRLDSTREEILALQQAAQDRSTEVQALAPIVVQHAEALMEQAAQAVPYRLDDRLAELELVRDGVQSGAMDPRTGASRLWRHVEDELKLCEESGLSRQAVELSEGSVLAQVAHLGLVALYFQTDDGRYGHATRDGEVWTYSVATGQAERAVADLFDALRKSVRSGSFTLPLQPPSAGGGS